MANPKFCAVTDVALYAGANANATSKAEAAVLVYGVGAESFINATTRYNWSDAYSALNVDVKSLLSEVQCCLIAMLVINYDMSGYSSRIEAETMLDVLRDRAMKGLDLLREQAVKEFMAGA